MQYVYQWHPDSKRGFQSVTDETSKLRSTIQVVAPQVGLQDVAILLSSLTFTPHFVRSVAEVDVAKFSQF